MRKGSERCERLEQPQIHSTAVTGLKQGAGVQIHELEVTQPQSLRWVSEKQSEVEVIQSVAAKGLGFYYSLLCLLTTTLGTGSLPFYIGGRRGSKVKTLNGSPRQDTDHIQAPLYSFSAGFFLAVGPG